MPRSSSSESDSDKDDSSEWSSRSYSNSIESNRGSSYRSTSSSRGSGSSRTRTVSSRSKKRSKRGRSMGKGNSHKVGDKQRPRKGGKPRRNSGRGKGLASQSGSSSTTSQDDSPSESTSSLTNTSTTSSNESGRSIREISLHELDELVKRAFEEKKKIKRNKTKVGKDKGKKGSYRNRRGTRSGKQKKKKPKNRKRNQKNRVDSRFEVGLGPSFRMGTAIQSSTPGASIQSTRPKSVEVDDSPIIPLMFSQVVRAKTGEAFPIGSLTKSLTQSSSLVGKIAGSVEMLGKSSSSPVGTEFKREVMSGESESALTQASSSNLNYQVRIIPESAQSSSPTPFIQQQPDTTKHNAPASAAGVIRFMGNVSPSADDIPNAQANSSSI